jgi:hypothetical protein
MRMDERDETEVEPHNRDAALIRRARERHGSLGAVVAGGMLGLEKVFERPAKEEVPAVWEAAGEPGDIDGDGIHVAVDDDRHVQSRPADAVTRRVVKRRRSG